MLDYPQEPNLPLEYSKFVPDAFSHHQMDAGAVSCVLMASGAIDGCQFSSGRMRGPDLSTDGGRAV
jgi:hypothetical protein